MARMHQSGFLLLSLVLFVSCDNPTSEIGLGLLEEGIEPVVTTVNPTVFDSGTLRDITGAVPRMLVGHVVDPLLGAIVSTGYIDFEGAFPEDNTSDLSNVQLELGVDYVYGDTTEAVTVDLFELTEDWPAIGRRADTVLTVGPLVTTFTFAPTDTLVTVLLPKAWVDGRTETLRSADFATLFHGFALQPAGGNAVVGFRAERSRLHLRTTGDAVSYLTVRALSGIVRQSERSAQDPLVTFQDGIGPGVRIIFDFSTYADTPINGAFVRIFADTVSTLATPEHFVRPLARNLQLVVVSDPDEPVILIAQATLSDAGAYRFIGAGLRSFFQGILFGDETFEHLELRAPYLENSIDAILLHGPASQQRAPEVVFILSP